VPDDNERDEKRNLEQELDEPVGINAENATDQDTDDQDDDQAEIGRASCRERV